MINNNAKSSIKYLINFMIDQSTFFEKYNIKKEVFEGTKLVWEDLLTIYDDYEKFKEELEPPAVLIFNTIMKFASVHSVRYRIKSPEHLIEKIIRKKIDDKDVDININNYKTKINDLIGLRALHLFKDDWIHIHDSIMNMWLLKEKPTANFRKGDADELINIFKDKDCNIKEHKYGYRSVHYIIETQPAKTKYFVEIQVRTIYEEAWSEIDHTIRYPYDLDNPIFFQFLSILNRLSGGADEMGSFVKFLKNELTLREEFHKSEIEDRDKVITDLKEKLSTLNIKDEVLNSVNDDLEKLRNQITHSSRELNEKGMSISDVMRRNMTAADILNNSKGFGEITNLLKSLDWYTNLPKIPNIGLI